MLGHSKEIISADVYGDTAEIIVDCLYAIEPFMEEVLPESREEKYHDYSDLKEIDEIAVEYLMESYKAIILTFSLRMIFLRVADIEHIKSHKGEILLWINSF